MELLAKVVDKGSTDNSRSGGYNGGYKTKITSIACDKWSGDRKLTARQYRVWKKHVLGIAQHHKLSDEETAFMISLNVTGIAKQALDIFENEDFLKPEILGQIWEILDEQHEELAHVRADEAYKSWEVAHRKHGESMNTWITNLKKIKLEIEAQDKEMIISRRQYASKLMRGSGLSLEKRTQVLFNSGGLYEPDRLSAVLRTMHREIQIIMNVKVKHIL